MASNHIQELKAEQVLTQEMKDAGFTYPGWYFWDETGAYCHGPYESQVAAEIKFCEYAKWLSTPRNEPSQAPVLRA